MILKYQLLNIRDLASTALNSTNVQQCKHNNTEPQSNWPSLGRNIELCSSDTLKMYWCEIQLNSRIAHSEPLYCPARFEPKYCVKETIQLLTEIDVVQILIWWRQQVDQTRPSLRVLELEESVSSIQYKAASVIASPMTVPGWQDLNALPVLWVQLAY